MGATYALLGLHAPLRGRSYYIGCTSDLDTRVGQHQGGEADGYTARRWPVDLVWAEEFQDVLDTIAAERRIKGWRAKKEALIADNGG